MHEIQERPVDFLAMDLDVPAPTKPTQDIHNNTITYTYNIDKSIYVNVDLGDGKELDLFAFVIMFGAVAWLLWLGIPYAEGMKNFITNWVI